MTSSVTSSGAQRIPRAICRALLKPESLIFLALLVVIGGMVIYPITHILLDTLVVKGVVTLDGFLQTWNRPVVVNAINNTVFFVVGSSTLGVIIGIATAWLVKRTDVPLASVLDRMPILPMLFPPVLASLGWAMLFSPGGGLLNQLVLHPLGREVNIFTIEGAVLVEAIYLAPWVHTLVAAGLTRYDDSLSEASRVAGGSAWSTFWRIELPMIRPHVFGAIIMCLTLSMSAYTVPVMLASVNGDHVLAVLITQFGTNYLFPPHAAGSIALVILLLAMGGTLLQGVVLGRNNRYTMIGGRARMSQSGVQLGRWRIPLFVVLLTYLFLAVLAPVLSLCWSSFQKSWGVTLTLSNLTLDNYREVLFASPKLWSAFATSLGIASMSATIVMIMATLGAFISRRTQLFGRSLIELIAMLSLGVPAVVFGLGALQAYIVPPLALYGTIWAVVLAYVGNHFGFGYRPVDAAMRQIDPSLEDASRVSGSGFTGTMSRVTLPLVWPSFISGWLLIFILMFREHPMSSLLTGPRVQVVSVAMYDYYGLGKFTQVAAFSMFVFLVILMIVLISVRLQSGISGNRR